MRIVFDLFPAHVSIAPRGTVPLSEMTSLPIPHGAYRVENARVILTDTQIVVVRDSDGGPTIVFREAYGTFENNGKAVDSRVQTTLGKTLAFRRDTSCACGSRLRGWNPLRHLSER